MYGLYTVQQIPYAKHASESVCLCCSTVDVLHMTPFLDVLGKFIFLHETIFPEEEIKPKSDDDRHQREIMPHLITLLLIALDSHFILHEFEKGSRRKLQKIMLMLEKHVVKQTHSPI